MARIEDEPELDRLDERWVCLGRDGRAWRQEGNRDKRLITRREPRHLEAERSPLGRAKERRHLGDLAKQRVDPVAIGSKNRPKTLVLRSFVALLRDLSFDQP